MDASTTLAVNGPLLAAIAVAVLAGAVSFASPCVVPLVPGYLAYLAALVGADAPAVKAGEEPKKGRYAVLGAAGLFVLGFTAVFVATLGTLVWLADTLTVNQDLIQRLGGVLTIAMALVFLGWIPGLQREFRSHHVPGGGVWGAPLLGAVFGLGWTPCIGPTLSAVTSMASATGGAAARGYLLILIYCLGLGVPFLLIALGARWAVRATDWLRRHGRQVQLFGGILLLIVGGLLVTGLWGDLMGWLRNSLANNLELPL
jgi:cytochrome c-type biogenesis protein